METTQVLTPDVYSKALAAWPHVDFGTLEPKFNSLLGAIFLASSDGSIWYFNPFDGALSKEWGTRAELVAALQTPEGDDEYLLGALAFGAIQAGVSPGPGQVFVYAPHPAIGGFGSANLMAMDFALAHEVYAQWHRSHRTAISGGSADPQERPGH